VDKEGAFQKGERKSKSCGKRQASAAKGETFQLTCPNYRATGLNKQWPQGEIEASQVVVEQQFVETSRRVQGSRKSLSLDSAQSVARRPEVKAPGRTIS
jgi:hypothetical protein